MSTTTQQLTFGQRIGVFILAEISAVSASSIIILLGNIVVCFLNLVTCATVVNPNSSQQYSTVSIRLGSTRRWRLESAVHLFLLNQLVCDLIQSLGKRCTVQGDVV
jgi:hypothetical protein